MSGELRNALPLLFPPGNVIELRAVADTAIHSGYFDNPEALITQALTLDSLPDVQGIYVTLNEVNPALLARRANRVKLRLGRKDATTSDADINLRAAGMVSIVPWQSVLAGEGTVRILAEDGSIVQTGSSGNVPTIEGGIIQPDDEITRVD